MLLLEYLSIFCPQWHWNVSLKALNEYSEPSTWQTHGSDHETWEARNTLVPDTRWLHCFAVVFSPSDYWLLRPKIKDAAFCMLFWINASSWISMTCSEFESCTQKTWPLVKMSDFCDDCSRPWPRSNDGGVQGREAGGGLFYLCINISCFGGKIWWIVTFGFPMKLRTGSDDSTVSWNLHDLCGSFCDLLQASANIMNCFRSSQV